MPPYLTRGGEIVPSRSWMSNPDPDYYVSWDDFAKQAFWEYQCGELFILSLARGFDGFPVRFRVIPACFVSIDSDGYRIGTFRPPAGDLLHIRYARQPGSARGVGPLEVGGARITAAATMARHVSGLVESGIAPPYYIHTEKPLTKEQTIAALDGYIATRADRPGEPAMMTGGADLKAPPTKSAKEMALVELAQFTESRIATLLGVPPFLVGLPSGGDSLTYSNVSQLFDFHERASLGPKVGAVAAALSRWALPRGTLFDLNRDSYTRPPATDRATYYKTLWEMEAITPEEVRTMERMNGDIAPLALTGQEE
jgi:phage portal protein BeeE